MTTKKQRKQKLVLRYVIALLVVGFSSILFINNTTQLFESVGISYQMFWVAWVGIIGSLLYALFKAMKGEL